MPKKDNEMVIGIDFGTTFTGVGWCFRKTPKDVAVITNWRASMALNGDQAKATSQLTYDRHGKVSAWGYREDNEGHRCTWFKLMLSREAQKRAQSQSGELGDLHRTMARANKRPGEVVRDYLQCVWEHTLETIKGATGKRVFDELIFKIVLTVPAIWDHQAQELTREAARQAGLLNRRNTSLEMISEPEAAARYVVSQDYGLKSGDCFIICDAGGGTVDLVSYKVISLHPLKLEMSSPPTGDTWGAVFLDAAFVRHLEKQIGADTWASLSKTCKDNIMNQWENGPKRQFLPHEKGNWRVSVLADQLFSVASRPMGSCGVINLETRELKSIFDSIWPRITSLIQEQIDLVTRQEQKQPTVFLVGGLGASAYLKEHISNRFSRIEIVQPTNAWSAICRGAVLSGVNNQAVVNHIAKYHYGIEYWELYDEQIHEEEQRVWDENEKCWVVDNQMSWYVNKGDSIIKSKPVREEWNRTILTPSDLEKVTQTIYYSKAEYAPRKNDANVEKLCSFRVDFSRVVSFQELPVHENKNASFRNLSYTLIMGVSSGSLDWSIEYNGLRIGSKMVKINWDPTN